MAEKQGKCILICAGELLAERLPVSAEDFVIAVDGGLEYCDRLGIVPDLILGDFDSLGEAAERVKRLEESGDGRVVRLPREKDDTDTLAALKAGLERGYREFVLYGCLGGRLDHTLANIQCLIYLRNHGATGRIAEEEEELFILQRETVHFGREVQGTLSLFAMSEECSMVTIEGMKYPLKDYTVRNDFPIGISNEFIGQEAAVTAGDGTLLCILRKKR